jgi:uncharacterized membrane protein
MKIEELSQRVSAFLPEIFLIIGLPMVLFFIFAVPPFQVPDEYAHLLRADQLSYGDVIGTRLNDTSSGGFVETSYRLLYESFETPGARKDKIEKAGTIPLTGIREFSSFPNTVRYGPLAYIPQVAALVIARAAGIKAIQAFYLARCFNAFAALATAFLALRLAKRGRFLIFCTLTMPMALFLMGSVSQDALLITGSALFLAITSQVFSAKRPPSPATYVVLVILLIAVTWGRLPYIALGAVFLLRPFDGMRWRQKEFQWWPRLAAIGFVVVSTVFWIRGIGDLNINMRPFVSAREQTSFLLTHLQLIPEIAFNSLRQRGVLPEVFGVLGLLDIKLPLFFYAVAVIGVVSAVALETISNSALKATERVVFISALLMGVGAVYLAAYLTWTPVGGLTVEGIEGRYFIPFILGLAFVMPTAAPHLQKRLCPLVLILPLVAVVGAVVSIQAITGRYY